MKAIRRKRQFSVFDIVVCIILGFFALLIVIPFLNVIVVSFTTQKEYATSTFLLFPHNPTLENYKQMFADDRILIGYRTTTLLLLLGVPINLLLTTSLAYGLNRKGYPGRKFIFLFVLFTMIFNGGIIPLYLVMKSLQLINTIWSVVLAYGVNTFYMIIMCNYFSTLPESLIESAKLDGAGEWMILFKIILPISAPIIATITLFYTVDRWNEWYNAMIFIRDNNLQPLQMELRSIVIDSQVLQTLQSTGAATIQNQNFIDGMKMCAVIVTMLPVMCVFPFLQKYFVKGMLIGAIKS